MGLLQSDTVSIIVDAVLTDAGRAALAKMDGSFNIVKYAFGDDEVDYTLIKKFGRTAGMEKIEGNNPVFEALTNPQYAQKYLAVSVSNQDLTYLPTLSLSGDSVSGNLVTIGRTIKTTRTITFAQTLSEGTSIDQELRDQSFIVTMDNRFIQLVGVTSDTLDRNQKATYIRPRDSVETSIGGSQLTLRIGTKPILESEFQTYGTKNDKTIINTFMRVTGTQSGAVYEAQIQINKAL
jgi:hypothetical protein